MLKRRILLLLMLAFLSTSAEAKADDAPHDNQHAGRPVTITVRENGGIMLQSESKAIADLASRLHAITQSKLNTPITFHVETNVSYGRVIEAMGLVSAAGYSDVKLEPTPP